MIEPFRKLSGRAVSLPYADIDTDVIYPARFLLVTEKRGLGRYAFHDRPDLNLPTGSPILVAGDNFGCGSSREQAPWALADLGVRVLIAPSFGEIFFSNCFKNGLLPIVLSPEEVDQMHAVARAGETLAIDLEVQKITSPQLGEFAFVVEPARREALLNGWNEIGRIMSRFSPYIAAFETAQRLSSPWLWSRANG